MRAPVRHGVGRRSWGEGPTFSVSGRGTDVPRVRCLLALEWFIGASALVGGLLLAVRPDGALLQAEVSALVAGFGLVLFEFAEFVWIGFQPLEVLFAAAGVTVMVLAWGSQARGKDADT